VKNCKVSKTNGFNKVCSGALALLSKRKKQSTISRHCIVT